MTTYAEFLDISVDFPIRNFQVIEDELYFHGLNMMELVETYDTPLRFTILPVISKKIQEAKLYFKTAFLENDYQGRYIYCYCTKSSHFHHVLKEALKNDIHLETSSAFDIPLIRALYKEGLISKDIMIICNGFKPEVYKRNIVDLIHDGFTNVIPVLDTKEELNYYVNELDMEPIRIGIRASIDETPDHELYSSRFGIRPEEIFDFYKHKIKPLESVQVVLFHFFIESGIRDTPYFWNELDKMIHTYCKFKKINPHLQYLDIGGGLPFQDSLFFEFDYQYMINEIVRHIKEICEEYNVPHPDIVTEFGSFTVAESSGVLFRVLGKKVQNDRERWYILDGSLMTTAPDIWALKQKYILLPLNNWDSKYAKVILGGITCDSNDYYATDAHTDVLFLPWTRKTQYLGFFHTGAYQEALSGVGGIHHCLIPTPRHVLIDRAPDGSWVHRTFLEEQNSKEVLRILGYKV